MERIHELRKEMGISMREAAKRLQMPYTTYVNYEKGLREPSSEVLITLARFFNVTIDYLVGNVNDPQFYLDNERILREMNSYSPYVSPGYEKTLTESSECSEKGIVSDDTAKNRTRIPTSVNIHPLPAMKRWQVLGGTACGQPLFKPLEDASVLAPADIDADFVFQCVGDSMINARIFDGDIVFIKEDEVPDGQIGVVRIGEEYTLKRIYHGTDYLELRSENPMYPPIIIRGEQENAEIVGRAVQFLSRVI